MPSTSSVLMRSTRPSMRPAYPFCDPHHREEPAASAAITTERIPAFMPGGIPAACQYSNSFFHSTVTIYLNFLLKLHLSSCARAHAYSIHRGFLFHPLKKPGFMPFFKTSAINTYSNKNQKKNNIKRPKLKCITAFYPFCGFVHPGVQKRPPPHAAEGRLVLLRYFTTTFSSLPRYRLSSFYQLGLIGRLRAPHSLYFCPVFST